MQGLLKRYLAVVYDALLMLALTMTLTALFYLCLGDASHGLKRLGLQALLWLGMGGYFVRSWSRSGQTLACQTWKLRVVDAAQQRLSRPLAIRRYALASLLLLPAGLTLWWALLDREHCFLHDRLLGTRIVAAS